MIYFRNEQVWAYKVGGVIDRGLKISGDYCILFELL